jgi:predicted CoA-binding protein
MKKQSVVVLGASNKTHRFSYRAVKLLIQYGHEVIPVHPRLEEIDGLAVVADLDQIQQQVDSLTLYIGEDHSRLLMDKILALKPGRVIFNPGTASSVLEEKLNAAGIAYRHDCTLVMLESNGFDI